MNSRFDFTIGSQTPHNVSCSSSLYSGDIGASTLCGYGQDRTRQQGTIPKLRELTRLAIRI